MPGQLERFRKAAASGEPIAVACTQEAPLFSEIANEIGDGTPVTFVNIRETSGWSKDAARAGPKTAALIAANAEPVADVPFVSLASDGVALLYGKDVRAIEAANLLKDQLDITVLIKPGADLVPPRVTEFPVVKGNVRSAKGYLGAFEVTVDDYATASPSSRGVLDFGAPRNGALSRCDIILDLSGGPSLFPAADLRDGYIKWIWRSRGDPACGAESP